METKHTPGPWFFEESVYRIQIKTGNKENWRHVADVGAPVFNDEERADAKLIASAPELLTNLIRLVERLEENDLGDLAAVKWAKEAIKKATE